MLHPVNAAGFEEITYNFFISRHYILFCDKVLGLVDKRRKFCPCRTPTKEGGEVKINGVEMLQLPCSVSVCLSLIHYLWYLFTSILSQHLTLAPNGQVEKCYSAEILLVSLP